MGRPTDVEFRSVWTTVAGRRVFARVSTAGPAGASPVVLVHGLGVSGRYLMPTARELAADHPTYVPDLPGYGRSPKPPRPLDIPGLADALAGWMQAGGLSEACLIANSLGCQTVIDLAVRHPELVGWAVLIGPTVDPQARTLAAQIARGTWDLLGEPPDYWPLLARDYLTAGPLRTLATLRLALFDLVAEKLPRVAAPTLVIRGTRDPIAPRRWVEEMASRLPCGQAMEIPGATHVANYTAPDAVAQAAREWMAAWPRAGRELG